MICPAEPCNQTETCGENVQRGPAGMVELRGLLDSTEKKGKKKKTDTTFTLYSVTYCHGVSGKADD